MATTMTPIGLLETLRAIHDTDVDGTYENVGATTIYLMDLDNTANGAASYVKFYNTANPTVGTTAPYMIVHVAASARRIWHFIGGNNAFTGGMSFAAVTGAGTAGTTSPTSDVVADLIVEG